MNVDNLIEKEAKELYKKLSYSQCLVLTALLMMERKVIEAVKYLKILIQTTRNIKKSAFAEKWRLLHK